MSGREREARALLLRLCRPGDAMVHREVERVGPIDTCRALADELQESFAQALERAAGEIQRLESAGARLVTPEDEEWPGDAFAALERVTDELPALRTRSPISRALGRAGPHSMAPPLALWARGPMRLSEVYPRSVSIVGSRAATGYGDHTAREIAFGVSERGFTVVSGGAYGIDAAAHRGALAAGGSTVAVLAGGVDVPYPKGNATLLERVAETGCLVSERPPGSSVSRESFLVRNRTIAALGAGTVVVEAPVRSGALATARRANALGREVMAVPGPVTSAVSAGCHVLIREYGATLVRSARDVAEMAGPVGEQLPVWEQGPATARDRLGEDDRRALDALPAHVATSVGELAAALGWPWDRTDVCVARLLRTGLVSRAGPDTVEISDLGRADGRMRV